MIKYTIIIPHKNTPYLLERALNSIPLQNDIHTIVVDDDSDPSIVDFNLFPGYNRLNTTIIFDKTGKGAGHARNIGIEAIQDTKWILFCDADDFFDNNINSILVDNYESSADIVYFHLRSVYSDTMLPSNRSEYLNQYLNKATNGYAGYARYKMFVPYGKLIKFDLIKDSIRFEPIRWSNDVMFSILCGHNAKSISIDNRIGYVSTVRNNSLIQQESIFALQTRYDVAKRVANYLTDNGASDFHSNLFAIAYRIWNISKVQGAKYFIKALFDTPKGYCKKDLLKCYTEYKSLKRSNSYSY